MINFDYISKQNVKKKQNIHNIHNRRPWFIALFNALFNLIGRQPDIDKL